MPRGRTRSWRQHGERPTNCVRHSSVSVGVPQQQQLKRPRIERPLTPPQHRSRKRGGEGRCRCAKRLRTLLAQQVSKELKSLSTITASAPRWELYPREGSRAIPIVSFRGPGLNVERKPSTCHSMHILLPLMLHLSRLISYTQYSVQVYYFI